MAFNLRVVVCNPVASILSSKYSTDSMKAHLGLFAYCHNLYNTCSRFCKCSCFVLPVMRISSIIHMTPGSPCRIGSMVCWKMAGAEATPKGSRV